MKKIIWFICVMLAVVSLAGCKGSDQKEIKTVLDSAFKAYQARNIDEVRKYTGATFQTTDIPFFKNNDALVDPVIQDLVKKTSISIGKIEVTGEQATAAVKVKVVNIGAVIRKVELAIRNSELTAEKSEQLAVFTRAVHEGVNASDVPMREYEVKAELQKTGGDWEIVLDNDIRDALTGGFITYTAD